MSIPSDLLREIDAFVRQSGMAPTTFGRLAANDGKLVATGKHARMLAC